MEIAVGEAASCMPPQDVVACAMAVELTWWQAVVPAGRVQRSSHVAETQESAIRKAAKTAVWMDFQVITAASLLLSYARAERG